MTSKGPKITLSNEKKVQEYRKEDKRVEEKKSDHFCPLQRKKCLTHDEIFINTHSYSIVIKKQNKYIGIPEC